MKAKPLTRGRESVTGTGIWVARLHWKALHRTALATCTEPDVLAEICCWELRTAMKDSSSTSPMTDWIQKYAEARCGTKQAFRKASRADNAARKASLKTGETHRLLPVL